MHNECLKAITSLSITGENIKLYTAVDETPSHENGLYKKYTCHTVVICKFGTCAPVSAPHSNATKFNFCAENITVIMHCEGTELVIETMLIHCALPRATCL